MPDWESASRFPGSCRVHQSLPTEGTTGIRDTGGSPTPHSAGCHNPRASNSAPPQEEEPEFIGRSAGNLCLVPALRNARIRSNFKGGRKIQNYTADMDPAAWIESYDLETDMLRADDGVCARYLTMML